jgi:hypothetical protein
LQQLVLKIHRRMLRQPHPLPSKPSDNQVTTMCCVLHSCRRQRSAAKEMLNIIKPLLPGVAAPAWSPDSVTSAFCVSLLMHWWPYMHTSASFHVWYRQHAASGSVLNADWPNLGTFTSCIYAMILISCCCFYCCCCCCCLCYCCCRVFTEGTQIQTVKVGCRGLAVVRVLPAGGADSAPVPVTDIVGQVLGQIEAGTLKHTK